MSVHYKFKSALDFDTITFDGLHISVGDLKKAITQQKRLGKSTDFDLQITNAQTREEYADDSTLIPKNTSLIIARIPSTIHHKKIWDPQTEKNQGTRVVNEPNSGILDLSQMNGTEEDKIQAMMIQSTIDYDPNNYQKVRSQGQTGEVPANYRCFKCHKPGHWIRNCTAVSSVEQIEMKRNTGIPRSFIGRNVQDKTFENASTPTGLDKKQEIPEDLICSICKDLLTDAVMIPCCGSSFCDECVRTALLESEENECPDCKEKGSSPGFLIPNRFLRNSVNAFKNETGYNKQRSQRDPPQKTQTDETNQQQDDGAQENTEDKNLDEDTTESVTEQDVEMETDLSTEQIDQDLSTEKQKTDAAVYSSHDENESDYEDNITVTVPPAHLQVQGTAFRERHYNGRQSRHIRPPGVESPPKNNLSSQTSPSQDLRSGTPPIDEKEPHQGTSDQQRNLSVPTHQAGIGQQNMRPIRSTSSDMYATATPITSYTQPQVHPQLQPIMAHGRPVYEMGPYGGVPPGPSYYPYIRGPFPMVRPGFYPVHQVRPRNIAPVSNLASVYQGVAAKVGSGIIDDPLEVFNRIMREKERRKGERRRTPDRRRSRSKEANVVRARHSPYRNRTRVSEEKRGRSPLTREKRARCSRDREKRSSEKDRRRNRSSSFSEGSSRSRSWSNTPRKRSKSPGFRRRSKSRSPSFSASRSRSRSNTPPERFRGPQPPMRYNRSPANTVPPRYRQKENRRPDRREDFQREDLFERSPGTHYMQRRPRSRGRINSPFFRQQERHFNTSQEEYFQNQQGGGGVPSVGTTNTGGGMYNDNYQPFNNRYSSREMYVSSYRGNPYSGNRDRGNIEYKVENRYEDVQPPGTEEPLPPGFENSPPQQRDHRSSWGHNQFTEKEYGNNEYRKHDDNQKDYDDVRHTPDLRERQSLERDERRRYGRDGRSWSKSSLQSSNNAPRTYEKGSRKSRSRTPIRTDKIQENYGMKERNLNKERHNSGRDGQGQITDREKEYEKKRERDDRDRKHGDHISKDKKDSDKKTHEKDIRHCTKEDKEKEKEKEKHKEQDKEKDKKRDSSEDEKKDKKNKEKRKKKKEKDEKKRIKKEKKEREKKEKEKEREKTKVNEKDKNVIIDKTNQKIDNEEKNQSDNPTIENAERKEIELNLTSTEPTSIFPEKSGISNEAGDNEKSEKRDDKDKFELYGDICQDEEIRYDYINPENNDVEKKETDKDSPSIIKRFDSVLDIHANLDFEPDLEEIGNNGDSKKDNNNVVVPLPELSKWEREDENQSSKDEKISTSLDYVNKENDDKASKVTTEVIRRAENAIFTRAISAIRPIEIKKISIERQKLYANEPIHEVSQSSVLAKISSPKTESQSYVSINPSSSVRSIEMKQEKSKRSPARSVRDRLGSQITDPPPPKRIRSRSISSSRKIHTESNRDKSRQARSRSKDYKKDDVKRSSDSKRLHESRAKSRDKKDFRTNDNRYRDQQHRIRDNDRRKDNFNTDRKKDKFRERERSRDKEKRRSPDKHRNKSGYDNERHGVKDQERNKERENRDANNKDHYKNRNREKEDSIQRKTKFSRSKSPYKNNKEEKSEKKNKETKRKHDEIKSRSPEIEKKERDGKENQKYVSQTSNFKNNNPEQNKEVLNFDKVINENLKKSEKGTAKLKSSTSNKRSRSASSSSTSSSDYESDSESEENKKKKKKKHKKDKKRTRRSSSGDSSGSTKHKRSKSKKKKSNKKKKKSKK